jgi:hypothetical protein
MIKRTRTIGGEIVSVCCSDDLQASADWLLAHLAKENDSSQMIGVDRRWQFGGMFLTFRRMPSDELAACVPDINADPFRDETADISAPLRLLAEQISFALELALEPVATTFQDKVVLDEGCLEQTELFLVRDPPDLAKRDSGWFIGRLGPRGSSPSMQALLVYQVLRQRPELGRALALPVGTMVTVNRRGISTVVDQNNEQLFEAPQP